MECITNSAVKKKKKIFFGKKVNLPRRQRLSVEMKYFLPKCYHIYLLNTLLSMLAHVICIPLYRTNVPSCLGGLSIHGYRESSVHVLLCYLLLFSVLRNLLGFFSLWLQYVWGWGFFFLQKIKLVLLLNWCNSFSWIFSSSMSELTVSSCSLFITPHSK